VADRIFLLFEISSHEAWHVATLVLVLPWAVLTGSQLGPRLYTRAT